MAGLRALANSRMRTHILAPAGRFILSYTYRAAYGTWGHGESIWKIRGRQAKISDPQNPTCTTGAS